MLLTLENPMDLSLVKSAFERLGFEAPSPLSLLEASTLQSAHVPPVPADVPLLVLGIESTTSALSVKKVLSANFSGDHLVQLVHAGATIDLPLSLLAVQDGWDPSTCLYVSPLEIGHSLEAFAEIVAHLRAPDGCPWDREQTHASLRSHLLEESYEALAAMDSGEGSQMQEEFGDLLLQIMLNAQIGHEEGTFSTGGVIKGIYDKIIRRHPHVFGEVQAKDADAVLQNWEKLKEAERQEKREEKGLLDGLPAALPALIQAQEYQKRAARVGFDWPEIEGVLDKIAEEIREVQEAGEPAHVAEELGDLFFALVNLARWREIDAEAALRLTNQKFKRRFANVEAGAKSQGRSLSDLSLDEMEAFWQAAKHQ
jgi:tetrapyrrole methylase family protein/MazG family protein